MEIREAKEGVEHTFSEQVGEQVKCPICNEVWNTDFQGDVTFGVCEHLRFFYIDQEFVEFYGDWDKDKFRADYDKITEKMCEEEGALYIIDAFKEVPSKDIDKIIYVTFDYGPMCQPFGLWGYKE